MGQRSEDAYLEASGPREATLEVLAAPCVRKEALEFQKAAHCTSWLRHLQAMAASEHSTQASEDIILENTIAEGIVADALSLSDQAKLKQVAAVQGSV